MSSRFKNFRRRRGVGVVEDDDNKGTTGTASVKPVSSSKRLKLLSFGDDEEETAKSSSKENPFSCSRLTKPSSAHKITSTKDGSKNTCLPSNVQPQAGIYTREALLELQKNTRTLAAPSSRAEPKIVLLKGLLKPQSHAPQQEEESMDLDSWAFPDQATIDSIKAKKDRFRKSFAPADYISFSDNQVVGGVDDEELSDEEEPEFQKGVFEVVEERAMGDEDNDDELWEEEQFRKGLGSNRVVVGISSDTNAAAGVASMPLQRHQKNQKNNKFGYSTMMAASYYGSTMSTSQQAYIAKNSLQQNLRRLQESYTRTISSLAKADENLSASLFNITALENSLSAARDKFIFMQSS